MPPTLLIAGIGNIFLGDDGFGVEVARRLARRPLPAQVRVLDIGIRGVDLAYALLDGYDAVILVDTTSRGGAPGTLYTIEPDLRALHTPEAPELLIEPHGLHPMRVLRWVQAMGGQLQRVFIIGCEPATLGPAEGLMGLSPPVQAAAEAAVAVIESLLVDLLDQGAPPRHRRLDADA